MKSIYLFTVFFLLLFNFSQAQCPTYSGSYNDLTITDDEVFIDGDLIIEEHGTLTIISSLLNFSEGSRIILKKFANLDIPTYGLFQGIEDCPASGALDLKPWEGIELQGANSVTINKANFINARRVFASYNNQYHKNLDIDNIDVLNCGQFIRGGRFMGKVSNSFISTSFYSLHTPSEYFVDVSHSVFGLQFLNCHFFNGHDIELGAIRADNCTIFIDEDSEGESTFSNWSTTFRSINSPILDVRNTEILNSTMPFNVDMATQFYLYNSHLDLSLEAGIEGMPINNCVLVNISQNTINSGNINDVGFVIDSDSKNSIINNNVFNDLQTGIKCEGDQGSMINGITFECNEYNGNSEIGIDARADIGQYQGSSTKASGNEFEAGINIDINYDGLGNNVNYYYFQNNPLVSGGGNLFTFQSNDPGCGQIGSNLDTNTPNSFCSYSNIEEIQTAIDLLNLDIAQLAGGENYLSTIISDFSPSNPTFVISELISYSPYLSVLDIENLFNHSEYYSEDDIVLVLKANPELISNDYIYNTLHSCNNFNLKSLNDLELASQTKTNRSAYNLNLANLELEKLKAIFCGLTTLQSTNDFDLEEFIEWLQRVEDFEMQISLLDISWNQNNYSAILDNIMTNNPSRLIEIQSLLIIHQILDDLDNSGRNKSELNSTEINTLNDIATNHFGFAANKARTILNSHEGTIFKTESFGLLPNCILFKNAERRSSEVIEQKLSISPNPSSSKFEINTFDEIGTIFIYDNFGSLVHKENLNRGRTEINIENSGSGVFTYQFKKDNLLISTGRIIKI